MATKSFNRRFHGRCGGKFSFFRNPFVFVILLASCSCGNRSNSHVIVELADARDFWSACT